MIVNDVIFNEHKSLKTKDKFHIIQGKLKGGHSDIVVGIDPGVNFGMTIISAGYIQVIYGKFPTEHRVGWHGIHIYEWMIKYFEDIYLPGRAIVEGAAYHSKYGQPLLEEVRFAFFLALHNLGFQVEIVPPATIRKVVFNNGKQQAGEWWPWLNHNGADSLSIALYALEEHAK